MTKMTLKYRGSVPLNKSLHLFETYFAVLNLILTFFLAIKVMKSSNHLFHDRASKGHGSSPGFTSQTLCIAHCRNVRALGRVSYIDEIENLNIKTEMLKGPQSATPLFLFTCEGLAIIFYSESVKTKKNHCETTQDNETCLQEHSLQKTITIRFTMLYQ